MNKLLALLLLFILTGCLPKLGSDLRDSKINSIKDDVQYGDTLKKIDFTDDNTGEDFIIKSDNSQYNSLGGDIAVYFSITNISGITQNADIVFSMIGGQSVRKVERIDSNQSSFKTIKKDISQSSSTPEFKDEIVETKTPIMTKMIFKQFNLPAVQRKSTLDNKIDKIFSDYFVVGQTHYYRAVVRMPMADYKKEWFIEAFGSSSYGHLDPNNWSYEQNFNSLTTATLIGQDSWALITGVNASAMVSETDTPYEGAKHVYIKDDRQMRISRGITEIVSGTFYVSMKPKATATWAILTPYQTATQAFDIYFNGTTNYIQAPYGTNVQTFSANTYYRIGIAFECDTGAWEGLAADTFKVNINNGTWETARAFYAGTTGINSIHFENAGAVANNDFWFDYISPVYSAAEAAAPSVGEYYISDE